MTDTLRTALYSIPASCDRETWWQVGAALKTELGDAGFALFDSWSQTAPDKYHRTTTAGTWRSVHAGPFTIGTVYHLARENGWQDQVPVITPPDPAEAIWRAAQEERERAAREKRATDAAVRAIAMIHNANWMPSHPYLVAKGFPETPGLSCEGHLLVPMRHYLSNAVQSVQTIAPDGKKKFLAGGQASQAVYKLGRAWTRWYVEGYATGLSVQAALRRLPRQDQVVVCFSAGNLAHIAPPAGSTPRAQYVIADHDWWRCPKKECRAKWDYESKRCPSCGSSGVTEPAGEKHAKQTGLPYWMPPEPGTDANDYHQAHGVEALAKELRRMQSTM